MNILYVTDILNASSNGVASAVNNYMIHKSKKVNSAIYALNDKIDNKYIIFLYKDYKKVSDLPKPFNKPDLVVFNEVYKFKYIQLYKECLKRRIPYLIIPHGCLAKKAQKRKKIKKIIANFFLFNRFINNSLSIQYLNENEKNNSVFKKQRCIVSGNGIERSLIKNKPKNKDFVYIGRYDVFVKGLDLLVKTVVENKEWFINNKIKIKLYGRNSGNGYKILEKMLLKNKLTNIIIINNPVYGNKKQKVLLESYAFVQVSRHEGQPIGIMEALSYGLPCIVTEGTSFSEFVNENECGIGIKFKCDELFNAIRKIYDDELFRNRCSKNAIIIERDFIWDNIMEKNLELYKNLL